MPIYTYEDEETGLRVDVNRPLKKRNRPIVLKRVPSRVGVRIAGAVTEDGEFNKGIIRGYHQLEEKEGSRFRSEHSAEKIKKTWEEN